jgi:YD repeat-containing protein
VREKKNRVIHRTDTIGRSTDYEYDSRGNRTRIINPAGRETRIAQEGVGPTSSRKCQLAAGVNASLKKSSGASLHCSVKSLSADSMTMGAPQA